MPAMLKTCMNEASLGFHTPYPAFTRRTELLDRRVNLQRVGLSNDATLLLKPSVRLAANIANPTEAALRPYINSGRSMRVVVLETEE